MDEGRRVVIHGLSLERLMELLGDVPDPRRPGGNLRHALADVVASAFCGVLCGCQDFTEVVEFVDSHLDFLREFLDLAGGVPSADTYERVFRHLDPAPLQAALVAWLGEVRDQARAAGGGRPVVAIDGKTLRRTFDAKAGLGPLHLVSAWASEEGLVLGQVATDAKSNEITAIPVLLDLVSVKGAVVTIDAAGCQREIAAKIVDKGGDYLLALKGNQPRLAERVAEHFAAAWEDPELRRRASKHVGEERGHGRIDRRTTWSAPAPEGLDPEGRWQGLASIVMICRESTDLATGRQTGDVRYFIGSTRADAAQQARCARSHWGIENGLHWTLDVVLNEDKARVRKDRGPENWAMLNRVALSRARTEKSTKGSLKIKRKRAGWNHNYLRTLLCASP